MRKSVSLALALLLVLTEIALLSSCGTEKEKKASEETDTAPALTDEDTADTEPEEDIFAERRSVRDTLPDDVDLGGETIRIHCRTNDTYTNLEFNVFEETGEVVSDAVFRRNIAVMDRLNAKMEIIGAEDTQHGGSVINNNVRAAVKAGDDIYDFVANHMSQITPLIVSRMFLDLADLEFPDWDGIWWNHSYNSLVTLNGHQFTCVGDLSLTMISGTYVTFFNKFLFDQYFTGEDLYGVVREGNWTLDTMADYCTAIYTDANGNGSLDAGDVFGCTFTNPSVYFDGLAGGANLTFIGVKEDGTYCWALENERTMLFVDKCKRLLHADNNCGLGVGDIYGLLRNDHVLFTVGMLDGTEQLRDMENDYGIIPMPKLDTSQAQYTTYSHNGFSVFALPVTCSKADSVGIFLEAMCAESYRSVIPAYYEIALKVKYARDAEAMEMLDLCTGGLVYDFGYLYSEYLNSDADIFRDSLPSSTRIDQMTSLIKAREAAVNKMLKKVVEFYSNYGN